MAQTRDASAPGRARGLLALGATVGLGLAVARLLAAPGSDGELPYGAVARVDGVSIRTESYVRLVAALASDRRTPLTDDDRRHVLDRLVDEELLVQYAVDLGLVKTDRRVRADLVTAVLAALRGLSSSWCFSTIRKKILSRCWLRSNSRTSPTSQMLRGTES